jgi:uncharacterized protein YndB with AHSA1/START domain
MNKNIAAKATMLVRRPVGDVFEAFIDPKITTKFWFTKSTGRLEVGKPVTWEWEMYGAKTRVDVKAIEKNRRILIEWEGYSGPETVEWRFSPHGKGTTLVTVTNSGFLGSEDDIVRNALDSTGGFTFLLAGLKAYLEHGIQLNLVSDAHPKEP